MKEYIEREAVMDFTREVFGRLAELGLLDSGEKVIYERYMDILSGYPAADVV